MSDSIQERLRRAAAARRQAEARVAALVAEARRAGVPWGEIGSALGGVTGEAARWKYAGGLEGAARRRRAQREARRGR